MKLVIAAFLFFFTSQVFAICNAPVRFFLGAHARLLEFNYNLHKGDGCPDDNGVYSLYDLMHENVLLRDDFEQIVRDTFDYYENTDKWSRDSILLQGIRYAEPSLYEQMKNFIIGNVGSILSLNRFEKEVLKENPVGALWTMFNGTRAQELQSRYTEEVTPPSVPPVEGKSPAGNEGAKDPHPTEGPRNRPAREHSGYLGTSDAFRHIAWNALSSRFGFEDVAARFIDAHEMKEEVETPEMKPSPNTPGKIKSNKPGGSSPSLSAQLIQIQQSKQEDHAAHNTQMDTEMDHKNNQLGREIAEELYCETDEDKIFNSISESIESGDAVIVDNCSGKPHRMIASDEKFQPCSRSNTPEVVKEKCRELTSQISPTATIEELGNLLSEENSPRIISCAYFKSTERYMLKTLQGNEALQSIFQKRDEYFERSRSPESPQQGFSGPFTISTSEFDNICSSMKSLNLSLIKEDSDCRQAINELGFSMAFEGEVFDFSLGIAEEGENPPEQGNEENFPQLSPDQIKPEFNGGFQGQTMGTNPLAAPRGMGNGQWRKEESVAFPMSPDQSPKQSGSQGTQPTPLFDQYDDSTEEGKP